MNYFAIKFGREPLLCTLFMITLLSYSSLVMGGDFQNAAVRGDLVKVTALLKANPNLSVARDSMGLTPLHYAAATGRDDVAAFLLDNHADVNAMDDNGLTPLHYAAAFGRMGVPELLLARKADVNAKDNRGRTPLFYAETTHHQSVAQFLREHGGLE